MMSVPEPVVTYLIFSLVNLGAVTYMIQRAPETKYASLEELKEQFQKRYS